MAALSYGLFVPIFFINIRLSVYVRLLDLRDLWFTLLVLIIAIIGKLFKAGLGAWWARMSRLQAFQLGAGMISRGEVGLIIATVGLAQGLMTESDFSVIVVMVVVTTLVTPPLHSSGLGRIRRDTLMDDLPPMSSLEALFQHEEYYSRTIFSVIDQENLIDKIVQATESVVGSLKHPNTDLLIVLPVHQVYGLEKDYHPKE